MKFLRKTFILVLVTTMFFISMSSAVKSEAAEIRDFSLRTIEDSKYSKYPYISFEAGQTCALPITISDENTMSSGYLNGDEGFTFTSQNTSIVAVDKTKGILKGKKAGSTYVTVAYPGLNSIKVKVTIIPERKDKGSQKDHEDAAAIDKMYKTKFKPENLISYRNKVFSLKRSSMTTKEHFMNIPNEYKITSMNIVLDQYLKEQKAIYYNLTSPKVSDIIKLNAKSMTVKLSRKITEADLVAYANAYGKKCDTAMKVKVGLYIYTGDSNPLSKDSRKVALVNTSIGLNEDTLTININKLLKTNKTYRVGLYYTDSYSVDGIITEGMEFTYK